MGAEREGKGGEAARRKVILAIGNAGLREVVSTLLQSAGPVKGISAGQVPMLRSVVAAAESGLRVTGNEKTGYRLRVPKNVQVVLEKPVETIQLPANSPLSPVTEVPQVIFRYGDQIGNQDMGNIGYPRDPLQGERRPRFRRR